MFSVILRATLFLAAVLCRADTCDFPDRLPPYLSQTQIESESCRAGLCVGPEKAWIPSSNTTLYYAEFNVPPLPESFSAAQTYFIYYNIIFKSDAPYGTNNQFVPQLMLGNPLCDSTGSFVSIFERI